MKLRDGLTPFTRVAFIIYLAVCITLSAIVARGVESFVVGNTLAALLFALAIAAPVLFHIPGLILGSVLLLSAIISLVSISAEFASQFYWLVVGCLAAALLAVVLLGALNILRNRALASLEAAQRQLKTANQTLESRVADRTAELEEANSAKTIFLANVSHELRTPLNHIIGFTQLVLDQAKSDLAPEHQEYLADALGSSKHLLSLINEVLDISAIEADRFELNCSSVNTRDVVTSSIKVIVDQAAQQQVTVTSEFSDVPGIVKGDELRLKQVLLNLLSNAIKFTPKGGEIVVYSSSGKTAGVAGTWLVRVSDNGIGIEKDALERIFDPFIRSTGPALDGSKNTGLGLAISRRIVELHSGNLRADSPGKDKGSTFTLEIPVFLDDSSSES